MQSSLFLWFAAPRETWDLEKGIWLHEWRRTWPSDDSPSTTEGGEIRVQAYTWGKRDVQVLLREAKLLCLITVLSERSLMILSLLFRSGAVTDMEDRVIGKKSLQKLSGSSHFILWFFCCCCRVAFGLPACSPELWVSQQPTSFQNPFFYFSSPLVTDVFCEVQGCSELLLMAKKWDISGVLDVI